MEGNVNHCLTMGITSGSTREQVSIREACPVSILEQLNGMSDETISSNDFRRDVEKAAIILRSKGFQRAPEFESQTPTTSSVVYVGRNVAFTFTLDIRDQGIDLVVTQYRDGKLLPTSDGGYSSSLFTHLINRCGFRGRPIPSASLSSTASKTMRALSALVNLLTQPCAASLLADRGDALHPSIPST